MRCEMTFKNQGEIELCISFCVYFASVWKNYSTFEETQMRKDKALKPAELQTLYIASSVLCVLEL